MYFSKVSDPKTLRIALLETSREVLVLLKQQKEFYIVRDKKKLLLESVRKDIREISEALKKLDDCLPEKQSIKQEIVDEQKRLAEQQKMLEKQEEEENEKMERDMKLLEAEERRKLGNDIKRRQEEERQRRIQEVKGRRQMELTMKNRKPPAKEMRKPFPVLRQKDIKIIEKELPEPPKNTDKELEKSSVTDLDRLEYTLSKIEQKLSQLKE